MHDCCMVLSGELGGSMARDTHQTQQWTYSGHNQENIVGDDNASAAPPQATAPVDKMSFSSEQLIFKKYHVISSNYVICVM